MKKKMELAYSRALVPKRGQINKMVICILIVVIIALIAFVKI